MLLTPETIAEMDATGHWYRYDDKVYSNSVRIELRRYKVLKVTLCGVRLDIWRGTRFVKRDAHKRFACPTKEEAMTSFLARKDRQKRILNNQLRDVERAEQAVESKKSLTDRFGHISVSIHDLDMEAFAKKRALAPTK